MLLPNLLSTQIINSLQGINTPGGVNIMWNTICDYVQSNAQVLYSWAATSTTLPPTPDPMVVISATINTAPGRVLSLPGIDQARDASTALSILSAGMNMAAATWMIQFPIGFLVSPCLIIPTISLSPSGLNNQLGAMNLLSTQVLAGIRTATPFTAGTHTIYLGSGSLISIL